MSSLTISVIVFGCVLGGTLLGIFVHFRLPDHHLSSDTRDVVRLGMALVATTLALVLGLLIASAKGFYDTQNTEVTQLAANVVVLDRILAHYGPETKEVRALLRNSVVRFADLTWPQDGSAKTRFDPNAARAEVLFDAIEDLSPKTDIQRSLQAQALGLAIQMGQTRWLIIEQKTSSVPTPLLVVLVFWLTVLFMSFGLFVRPNVTIVTSLLISALAVCSAIFLILEMYQPYAGLIQVSGAPVRVALMQLGQ